MIQIIFVTTIVAIIYGNAGVTYSFLHCARSSCAQLGPCVHTQPAAVTPLAGVPNLIRLHPDTVWGSTVTCCCYSRSGGDGRRLDCNKGWTYIFLFQIKWRGQGECSRGKEHRESATLRKVSALKRGWKVPLITRREGAEEELQTWRFLWSNWI